MIRRGRMCEWSRKECRCGRRGRCVLNYVPILFFLVVIIKILEYIKKKLVIIVGLQGFGTCNEKLKLKSSMVRLGCN